MRVAGWNPSQDGRVPGLKSASTAGVRAPPRQWGTAPGPRAMIAAWELAPAGHRQNRSPGQPRELGQGGSGRAGSSLLAPDQDEAAGRKTGFRAAAPAPPGGASTVAGDPWRTSVRPRGGQVRVWTARRSPRPGPRPSAAPRRGPRPGRPGPARHGPGLRPRGGIGPRSRRCPIGDDVRLLTPARLPRRPDLPSCGTVSPGPTRAEGPPPPSSGGWLTGPAEVPDGPGLVVVGRGRAARRPPPRTPARPPVGRAGLAHRRGSSGWGHRPATPLRPRRAAEDQRGRGRPPGSSWPTAARPEVASARPLRRLAFEDRGPSPPAQAASASAEEGRRTADAPLPLSHRLGEGPPSPGPARPPPSVLSTLPGPAPELLDTGPAPRSESANRQARQINIGGPRPHRLARPAERATPVQRAGGRPPDPWRSGWIPSTVRGRAARCVAGAADFQRTEQRAVNPPREV